MRTKASIKGHAIHQMLIPFPFAFLIGSFLFDIIGLLLNNTDFHKTSFYLTLAGIFFALLAAVPGFIDYLYSVPPKSTGKIRATKHFTVNLLSVALFVFAVLLRDNLNWSPSAFLILIETSAVVLLSIGGWMGGTLVNRNFIGPDHRYAQAGKWSEISFNQDKPQYQIATSDELNINQMKLVRIKGKRIVLCRAENGWYAFDDSCTHRGGSLAGGISVCNTVQCLWHGSQFDVRTGNVNAGPAKNPVKTYPLIIENGKIILKL